MFGMLNKLQKNERSSKVNLIVLRAYWRVNNNTMSIIAPKKKESNSKDNPRWKLD